MRRWVIAGALCFAGDVLGCGSSPGGNGASPAPSASSAVHPLAPPGDVPAAITMAAGSVIEGTSLGTVSKARAVGAYRISTTPTTVAQFRQCVAAGACAAPAARAGAPALIDGPTYAEAGNDSVPVVGVDVGQATAYCSWVGGELPTAAEWLLAARGTAIQRHPWTAGTASCAAAPRTTFFATGSHGCCGASCSDAATFTVGQHPAGDSVAGLEDVAMLRAELLRSDSSSVFPACSAGMAGCAVGSIAPGSIDFVTAITNTANFAAGFRCVWEGAGQ